MTRPDPDPRTLVRTLERARARALQRFRSGQADGPLTASALARGLDGFLRAALASSAALDDPSRLDRPRRREGPFAVFAVGSYGRAALCFHSDVDCLLLHLGEEPHQAVHAIAEAVRALWDIGIRARVAVYSLSRARRLIAADPRVLASLLDHRLVMGSPRVADALDRLLAGLPDRHVRRLARLILREDQARAGTRHQDLFAAEPDVKTGQGGLRDDAALRWFARWTRLRATLWNDAEAAEPSRRRASRPSVRLLSRPGVRAVLREVSRQTRALARARATLLTARLFLDAAGIPRDRFTREAASILERERLASYVPVEFERDLAAARFRISRLLNALVTAVVARSGPTHLEDDLAGPLLASVRSRTRTLALPLPPRSPTDAPPPKVPAAVQAFLDVLSSRQPRTALEALLRTGALHRVVPGFQRTFGLVPGDEVHAFTVDRHLVLAAVAAADILDGIAPVPAGTDDAVRTGARHRVPLLLAAMLHDIGKTVTTNASVAPDWPRTRVRVIHPEAGARLARLAALKLGLPRDRADLVAFLCRHHMTLPEVSTTLDCESPEVLARLAQVFTDGERLDLAFLVALADLRSLGPEIATTFREALLARAWSAVRRWLGARDGTAGWEAEVSARRSHLLDRCAAGRGHDWFLPEVIRSLPDRLLMAFDLDRLWAYLLRFESVQRAGPMVLVESPRTTRDSAPTDHEIVYLGHDEMGLLSRLSGALTLHGLSIQEARIFSISPGRDGPRAPLQRPPGALVRPHDAAAVGTRPLVLDQFRVSDPRGVIGQSPDARQALGDRILASAADPALARRIQGRIREALRARRAEMIAEVDNTSLPDRTVFRMAGPDAPGLLHLLADVLYRHGVNVTGAIVTTEAGTARDTFFAEWGASGGKVLDPEVIRKVLRAISQLGRPG